MDPLRASRQHQFTLSFTLPPVVETIFLQDRQTSKIFSSLLPSQVFRQFPDLPSACSFTGRMQIAHDSLQQHLPWLLSCLQIQVLITLLSILCVTCREESNNNGLLSSPLPPNHAALGALCFVHQVPFWFPYLFRAEFSNLKNGNDSLESEGKLTFILQLNCLNCMSFQSPGTDISLRKFVSVLTHVILLFCNVIIFISFLRRGETEFTWYTAHYLAYFTSGE
jgi:hypothetical protein